MDTNEKIDRDNNDNGHDDPANWIGGMFYNNPKDKRLFPPKRRFWAGWTINFARKWSIVALIVFIILIIFFTQWFYTHVR